MCTVLTRLFAKYIFVGLQGSECLQTLRSNDIVEAHCYFVDIGRIDREQIRSRINNNDCRLHLRSNVLLCSDTRSVYKSIKMKSLQPLRLLPQFMACLNIAHAFLAKLQHPLIPHPRLRCCRSANSSTVGP